MTIIQDEIVRMTFDAFWSKNLPFAITTFHSSRRGFAPEANVAAIERPNWHIPMLKKIIKIKVPDGFDSFLCYLAAKTYGYICLTGSRKFICSLIIWVQDSALN